MQQDLHLETATVRESLTFSALCRQSSTTSRADKVAYVEEVIRILEMELYASAVVGVPGEGLNVGLTLIPLKPYSRRCFPGRAALADFFPRDFRAMRIN